MSAVTTDSPAPTPVTRIHDVDHVDRDRHAKPPRIWLLVEALAYAGASIDPASALAAQRFARIRDEERRNGG